jgi:hypothetical protein
VSCTGPALEIGRAGLVRIDEKPSGAKVEPTAAGLRIAFYELTKRRMFAARAWDVAYSRQVEENLEVCKGFRMPIALEDEF